MKKITAKFLTVRFGTEKMMKKTSLRLEGTRKTRARKLLYETEEEVLFASDP